MWWCNTLTPKKPDNAKHHFQNSKQTNTHKTKQNKTKKKKKKKKKGIFFFFWTLGKHDTWMFGKKKKGNLECKKEKERMREKKGEKKKKRDLHL